MDSRIRQDLMESEQLASNCIVHVVVEIIMFKNSVLISSIIRVSRRTYAQTDGRTQVVQTQSMIHSHVYYVVNYVVQRLLVTSLRHINSKTKQCVFGGT